MNTTDVETRLATALHHESQAAPAAQVPTREQLSALVPASERTAGERTRWQYRLLAAAAAVVLATGTGVYFTGDHDSRHHPVADQARPISASQFLLVSARTVLAAPFTAPRPDQVDYARTVSRKVVTTQRADGQRTTTLAGLTTTEVWSPQTLGRPGLVRYDHGDQTPYIVPDYGEPLDLKNYASLSRLPLTDPARLLADIASNVGNARHAGDDSVVDAFKVMVNGGLFEQVLPPDLSAAVYTALSEEPEVTARRGAADVLGRPAVAIGVTDSRGYRWEVLFDEHTHTPIGTRVYPVADGPAPPAGHIVGDGVDYGSTAIVQVATVNQAGQLPRR